MNSHQKWLQRFGWLVEAVDVHMSDLIAGTKCLADYQMLAACGGFLRRCTRCWNRLGPVDSYE